MAIPGPSKPSPPLSWRQVQSQLRNVVLASPLRDIDSLLDVLLPTLHILDLVPPSPAVPLQIAHRHSPQRVFGKLVHGRPLEDDAPLGGNDGEEGEEGEEAWLRAFRNQAWLGDVQKSLLTGPIAATWDHEMRKTEPEMWEALRRAWFVPPAAEQSTPSSSKLIQVDSSEDKVSATPLLLRRRQSSAAVTLSGLQALSSALSVLASSTGSSSSSPSPSRSPMRQASNRLLSPALEIAQWYAATPDLLNRLIEATHMQGNAAKRSLVSGEVVKILASLQDRVANAIGNGGERADAVRFARSWSKSLQRQLVERIFAKGTTTTTAGGDDDAAAADLALLADLFTKLIRTNPQLLTATDFTASSSDFPCFLALLLRHLISLSTSSPNLHWPSPTRTRWHLFLSHLDSRDRHNVDFSLAHFLHRRFLQVEVVDGAKERGRPAAVGRAFLSGATARTVETGARFLEVLWGSSNDDDEDDDDDDDDDDDTFIRLMTQIVLPPQRSTSALLWGPGMARAFVCYFAGPSSSPSPTKRQRLQSVLTRAVEQWGNAARVRRTTAQEEHYLVALILGVLAELTNSSSSNDAAATSGLQPGLTTSRSSAFIQGVGAHLEHPEPEVRRMGMLLAELVSEVACHERDAAAEKRSHEDGAAAAKPLSFGSSMWDGTGDGREEARVLRAMWHAWGTMRAGATAGVEGMKREEVMEMLALSEQREEVAQEVAVAVAKKSVPRQAPRTRQLPQRVPTRPAQDFAAAPSKAGGRSLIVELDDDDEGKAAGSSTRHSQGTLAAQPRPVVSVESDNDDSSSESGSSSDDDNDGDQPTLSTADADLQPGAPKLSRPATNKRAAAANDDQQDELLGLGIDKKRRRPPPVHISDLTAMLRDHKERDSIRLALKHGEELLRRKGQLAAAAAMTSTSSSTALSSAFSTLTIGPSSSSAPRGPRGEIDEHCIDLLLLLCALQNNYRIRSFEARRRGALRALVVWAPRIAVPALIEQVFAPNYSITQRLGMLEALGWGAREVCGCEDDERAKRGEAMMRGWTDEAIGRARKEGEERVPEIKKERDLQRLTDVGPSKTRMLRRPQEGGGGGGRVGIQEIGGASGATGQSVVHRQSSQYGQQGLTTSRSAIATPPLSSSLFLFPLITRLRSHLSDASTRLSRARHISSSLTLTSTSTTATSLGLALPDLFTASPPLLLPAILDTLALLTTTYVSAQRPVPLDAHGVVLPEMLELAMHVVREGLPLLAFAAHDGAQKQQQQGGDGGAGSGNGNVVLAIASLILVTLDLALESTSAEASRLLVATERGAATLDDALRFASGVFESEDAKSSVTKTMRGNAGSGGGGMGMGISRTGRICAAIVVRIEELRARERERWLGGVRVGEAGR